jgi:hypothetical protein
MRKLKIIFFVEKVEKNPKMLPSKYAVEDEKLLSILRAKLKLAKAERSETCRLLKCPECAKRIKTSYRMMCHLKKHV